MNNISDLLKRNSQHHRILEIAGYIGEKEKIPTFIVGGYIRDLILGRNNNPDIDIMVEGDALKYAKKLSKTLKFGKVIEYGQFNTALIPCGDIEIEVAGSRKEEYKSESRKPMVSFANVKEDMARRDFTVNAIAASLWNSNFGQLYDPFNGLKDINQKKIITPLDPDKTFKDDPLRMMRACRFAAQLDFIIDPQTLESMKRQVSRIEIISKERITEEIIKTLKSDIPSIGFYKLKEVGLLKYIFPEIDIMPGVEVINGKGHKDVFIHTLQVVDNAAKLTKSLNVRFAALVHDIAKPNTKRFYPDKGWTFHGHEEIGRRMLKKVAKRMKLSNELRDYLMLMTKLHLRPIALAKRNITDSAVRRVMYEAGEFIDDLMTLCRADITSKNPKKVQKYRGNFERVDELMRDIKMRDEMRAFQSPLRGNEIMKIFNIKEGEVIGEIKSAIEEAILDGLIENSYDAAYKYMIDNKNNFLKS
ncbi:MAG: tRNA nucleotidyltransferase [Candidatus Marinimicrobia bacterium]|nr:tRNA nucleotidyltransferase [Candidatus Neomarinimicrobiota bacterium]